MGSIKFKRLIKEDDFINISTIQMSSIIKELINNKVDVPESYLKEIADFYETAKHQPNVMLRKYNRKCESVADYITLLNTGTQFTEYRQVRNKETITQNVNLDEIINTFNSWW